MTPAAGGGARPFRIALDAMGGDGAPGAVVKGALAAREEWPGRTKLLLIGDPIPIRTALGAADTNGIECVAARETIGPDESPALAVRRKRDSSIVVGLDLLQRGEADAFLSAGSTGAVMAASLLALGPLPGVERPAIGAVFPTSGGPTLVLDVGANVDPKATHLHQSAHLGAVYVRDLHGTERPRIGLLNVGEEPEKGGALASATYRLLAADRALEFVGNVEAHRIIEGVCDVLVCDGFTGNVLLKFYESMAGFIDGLLHQVAPPEHGGARLQAIYRLLDYTEYGGAPLLGVNGVSVICHGASPPRAIKNAIREAARCLESGLIGHMAEELGRLAADGAVGTQGAPST